MNTVGQTIKRLRKESGLTQDQLAEKLFVTHQAVSSWETGKTQPDVETLGQLADIFGVSVEMLIYGTPRPHSDLRPQISVSSGEAAEKGISFGCALAIVISYVHWHSIGWAIFHGLLGWVYVIYYAIKYAN